MKKLFLSLMALAALAVGCQQDNPGLDYDGKDSVPYTISVAVPELAATRANETEMTGMNSGLGAIDNFSDDVWRKKYDLRYMMEIYDATDGYVNFEEPIKAREIKTVDAYSEITFETRLIPNRNYKFVVWADFVKQGEQGDLCYDTADLNAITRKSVVAMDECQDAYFIQKDVTIKGTGINERLELKRPFGKIRVITTDYNEVNIGSEPAWVNVTFHDCEIYESLNAVTGDAEGNTLESYTTYSYKVSKGAPYTDGYDSDEKNMTLFADYILAGNENKGAQEVNFTIEVIGADQRVINSHDFNTQIPLERNHLTTIVGNLLTVQNDINVFVDDDFDGEYIRNWDKEAINIDEDGFGIGELNDNNNYEFVVTAGADSFTLVVPAEVVDETTGNFYAAELNFVDSEAKFTADSFTIKDLKVDVTRAAVEAIVNRGNMVISNIGNGVKNIMFDLYYTTNTNPDAAYVKYNNIRYQYNGYTQIKVALATPVVEVSVEGNVITLTWDPIEGAANYSVTCGTEMPVFVDDITYTFTGEYDTAYTFYVVAMPENENKHYASEPVKINVTTDAATKEITFVSHYTDYNVGGEIEYYFETSDNKKYRFDFYTALTDEEGFTLMVANTEENPYYILVPEATTGQKFDILGNYSMLLNEDYSTTYFSAAKIKVTQLEKGNFMFEGQFKLNNGDPTTYTFVYTEPEPEPEPEPESKEFTLASLDEKTYNTNKYGFEYSFATEDGNVYGSIYINNGMNTSELVEGTYAFHNMYGDVYNPGFTATLRDKNNNGLQSLASGSMVVTAENVVITLNDYILVYTFESTVTPEPKPEVYTDFAETAEMTVVFGQTRYVSETYTLANNNWQENADEYNYGSYTTTQEGNVYKFSFTDEKNKRNVVITYTEETGGGNEGGEWIGREVKLQLLAYQENSLLYTKVNNESKYFMTTFRNGIVAGKFVLAGDNKSEEIMTAGHAASQYGLFGGTTLFADGDTVEVIDNGGGSYTIIYRVTVNGENLTATYSGTL